MNFPQILGKESTLKFLTVVVLGLLLASSLALLLFLDEEEALPGVVRINVRDNNEVDGVADSDDVYGEQVFAIDHQVDSDHRKMVFTMRLNNPVSTARDVQMKLLDKTVTMGGDPAQWDVVFRPVTSPDPEFNYSVDGDASTDFQVVITPPISYLNLREEAVGMEAVFVIGGAEKAPHTSWYDNEGNFTTNTTFNEVTLKVLVGKKNIAPWVEAADGEVLTKTTNPNRYTEYLISIKNLGSQTDSFEINGEFLGKTRGEIGDGWFLRFGDPYSDGLVEDLAALDTSDISVQIKPPRDAERGNYQIVLTMRSVLSSKSRDITLVAKVPKPELDIIKMDASPSPALDNVDEVDLRVTVKNTGSYVPGDITVSFAVQYNENEGWTPVGQTIIDGLESAESKSANVSFTPSIPDEDRRTVTIIKFRAEVDENGQISEDSKSNNMEESELEIVLATSNESSFSAGSVSLFLSLAVAISLMAGGLYRHQKRLEAKDENKKQE